jgi:hypothetical protein
MGSFKPSTPTAGLQIAMGLPPLDLKIAEIALGTYRRLKLYQQIPSWDGNGYNKRGHISILKRLHSEWSLPELHEEDIIPLTRIDCDAELEEDSFKEGIDCGYDSWRIYTDGSKIEEETRPP